MPHSQKECGGHAASLLRRQDFEDSQTLSLLVHIVWQLICDVF